MSIPIPAELPKRVVTITALEQGVARVLATIRWTGERVEMEGDEAMLAELSAGVQDPETGDTYRPEDGFSFLGMLPLVYHSPYLFAAEAPDAP